MVFIAAGGILTAHKEALEKVDAYVDMAALALAWASAKGVGMAFDRLYPTADEDDA